MHSQDTAQMHASSISPARDGICACQALVADHFDRQNRWLGCDAARRRQRDRFAVAASHRDLLIKVIATVRCAQLGTRLIGSPLDSLEPCQRLDVALAAEAALTLLNRDKVDVARERAIDRGLDELRQHLGQRELAPRTKRQFAEVLRGVLVTYKQSLQGLIEITERDVVRTRAKKAERLPEGQPASTPEPPRRVETTTREAEGEFRAGRDAGEENDAARKEVQ